MRKFNQTVLESFKLKLTNILPVKLLPPVSSQRPDSIEVLDACSSVLSTESVWELNFKSKPKTRWSHRNGSRTNSAPGLLDLSSPISDFIERRELSLPPSVTTITADGLIIQGSRPRPKESRSESNIIFNHLNFKSQTSVWNELDHFKEISAEVTKKYQWFMND